MKPAQLLSIISTLTLFAGCIEDSDQPTEAPLARFVASERSLADLGVSTWEVRADGADVRVIGYGEASARQAEVIIRRDAADPEERVQIEGVFPDRGELELTRAGDVEHASSDYLRRLGLDIHADLQPGATAVVSDYQFNIASAEPVIAYRNYPTPIHLGWNLWGYWYNTTVGGSCPSGTVRDHGEIYAQYGAFSAWQDWAYPGGPITDCTARFTMYVNNGHWDDFYWSIYTRKMNLAAGKAATQSSSPFGGDAQRAVDGNTNGNWFNSSVSHTGFEFQPWWQVDLGAVKSIGEVVVFNRTDCCSERLSNFDILLSSDGIDWQVAASFSGVAPTRTPFAVSGSGRLVRVRLRGTDYLSLAEVEVFQP